MNLYLLTGLLLASVFGNAQNDSTGTIAAGSGIFGPPFRAVSPDTSTTITVIQRGEVVAGFRISSVGSIVVRPPRGSFSRTDWAYRNGKFTHFDLYDFQKQGGAPLLILSWIVNDTFESYHLYNLDLSDERFERIADLMCDSLYTARVVGWSQMPGKAQRTREIDIYQNVSCMGCLPNIDNDEQMKARLLRAILDSRNPNAKRLPTPKWPCPDEVAPAPVAVKRDTTILFSGSGQKLNIKQEF